MTAVDSFTMPLRSTVIDPYSGIDYFDIASAISFKIAFKNRHKFRIGLEGNLCRCTGYHNIVKSVLAAADA